MNILSQCLYVVHAQLIAQVVESIWINNNKPLHFCKGFVILIYVNRSILFVLDAFIPSIFYNLIRPLIQLYEYTYDTNDKGSYCYSVMQYEYRIIKSI